MRLQLPASANCSVYLPPSRVECQNGSQDSLPRTTQPTSQRIMVSTQFFVAQDGWQDSLSVRNCKDDDETDSGTSVPLWLARVISIVRTYMRSTLSQHSNLVPQEFVLFSTKKGPAWKTSVLMQWIGSWFVVGRSEIELEERLKPFCRQGVGDCFL